MSAVPTRSDPALVRLDIDPTGAREWRVRVVAVAADGGEREVTAWSVPEPCGDVAVSRAPDGSRVGVLVGEEVRTMALADGTGVAGAGVRAPEARPSDVAGGSSGVPVLVWDGEVARVIWPAAGELLQVPLADGWSIELEGDAEVDPDQFSGDGGTGLPHVFFADVPPDADPAELRRQKEEAEREMRAEDDRRSRVPATFRLVARRGGRATTVHHEERSLVQGSTTLHWPPVVTPHGLLLRRSVSTAHDQGQDHVMQHPWLVTPDGEVRTLPFQLGVGPRDTLPDGRLLLPGYHPLWWDGSDEPPSALSLEGDAEPLRVGPHGRDDHARPHRLLRDAFPGLAVVWPPPDDDEGWRVVDARADGEADEVVVLLAEGFPEPRPAEDDAPTSWAVVAFGLAGEGPVRGIARGTRPAGTGTSFAL